MNVKDKQNIDRKKKKKKKKKKNEKKNTKTIKTKPNKCSIMSKKLFDPKRVGIIKTLYQIQKPFPLYRIQEMFNEDFAVSLRKEVEMLEFCKRSNDLLDFAQTTQDLGLSKKPFVRKIVSALYSQQFRNILTEITGIELSEQIDMFAAVYGDTDRLLCHDDCLNTRRIAYIFYLVEKDWNSSYGGDLCVFETDKQALPVDRVHTRYTPEWNSFTFFEVSNISYHQVEEVIAKKNRVSIGGWFHGKYPARPPKKEIQKIYKAVQTVQQSSEEWVARDYRRKKTIKKVKKNFAEESSVSLVNFLREDKYKQLLQALKNQTDASWKIRGPRNKKRYLTWEINKQQSVETNKSPRPQKLQHIDNNDVNKVSSKNKALDEQIITQLNDFFSSSEFCEVLKQLTGLDDIGNAGCLNELQKFEKGHYTLIHDGNADSKQAGLDVIFCCIPRNTGKHIKQEYGGAIHYVIDDEEDELMRIDPEPNTLSILYRAEEGISKFVRYMTHYSTIPIYYFNCTFKLEDDE